MDNLLGIILLAVTVVAANIVHLLYPKIPLSIYQIIAGVLLALLPTEITNFSLHPEIFMMVVIAPLMFNDGQNQSFRYLTNNFRSIFSISVILAIVTVLITGSLLHSVLPQTFPFALAFMLAAIITPTDAVAVKSITNNMTVPENVNGALEYESLFNDASGIVLLDLSLAAYQSGKFSLGHGLWIFIYVFFGGILFGAFLGVMLVQLRVRLMRNHVDIASIVIPMNVLTPIIIYWAAEELHFSGILAVVSAGVIHSILYDQLQLTSTKVQVATGTIWSIVSDALNGIVFVLLGVMLPQVLGHTSLLRLLKLTVISLLLYLVMTALRFIWVRLRLIHIGSAKGKLNRDSLLMALGGIHGTITLALAFSLPVMVDHHTFAFRNAMILISAIVILISLLVGAICYPLILPPKSQSYTHAEFHQELSAAVHYAISELVAAPGHSREKAAVIEQLGTQGNRFHQFNRARYSQLMTKAHEIELETLDQLTDDGIISRQEARFYARFIARAIFQSRHRLSSFWVILHHRIKWRRYRKRHPEEKKEHGKRVANKREVINKILKVVNKNINDYLDSVENDENTNEVTLVRRVYLQQKFMLSQDSTVDADHITTLFIEAFQAEHSYVQQQLAAGELSQELANALNEQISTDELVYVQSLD